MKNMDKVFGVFSVVWGNRWFERAGGWGLVCGLIGFS